MSALPEMYVCLYAREFPAQALLRLRPELRRLPLAVMAGEPPLQQVCSCNAQARAAGIVHGMTQVEAGTIPAVMTLLRSRNEERTAHTALLECAGSFSPRVEDRSEDAAHLCVLDIRGTERLFGAPAVLAKSLVERVRALGITAVAAVSANFHTAICMARSMSAAQAVVVVPAGDEARALANVPLPVLDLDAQRAETFSQWGIRTLGMLAALPETALVSRMGQEGRRLRQLARGELPHLFLPVDAPLRLEERMELDSPVEALESLLFAVGVMLEQLILRAVTRVLALASVTLTLLLEGGATHTRSVRPALPHTDRQLWIKLIHLDLEAHPPVAAVLGMALSAEPGSTSKVQLGLFSPQLPEAGRLDITLARIRAIVGEDRVGRAVLKDTHQPEGFGMQPFTVPSGRASGARKSSLRTAMRQLRPPEKLTVGARDERPETFFFRGKKYTVERAYGPWLASGDWWSGTHWSMEQWDLIARTANECLCCAVFRDLAQGRWLMAGFYD